MILMLNTDWFHEDDDSDENESEDEDGGGVDDVYNEVNEGRGGGGYFVVSSWNLNLGFALLLPPAIFLTGDVFWDFLFNLRPLNLNKVAMRRLCRWWHDEEEEPLNWWF